MKRIIPAIIAINQKELDMRLEKVKIFGSSFQLDVMDGKFVPNKSLWFNFKVSKKNKYEAHLMVKNPEKWIKENLSKVSSVIIHIETVKDPTTLIDIVKKKKKKIGIALNPETPLEKVDPYVKSLNKVLVMTVDPGAYGGGFLPQVLQKIRLLRSRYPKLNIQVDGGLNPVTVKKVKQAGANEFVIGSYLQQSINIKEAKTELNLVIK
tara:strand:- start:1176 stop:1799 length:624 start_codon:yes stop_codon:yes gene_type:complete